jgi:hypothetical protein
VRVVVTLLGQLPVDDLHLQRGLVERIRVNADACLRNRREPHANTAFLRVGRGNRLERILLDVLFGANEQGEQVPDLQEIVIDCQLALIEACRSRNRVLLGVAGGDECLDLRGQLEWGVRRIFHHAIT